MLGAMVREPHARGNEGNSHQASSCSANAATEWQAETLDRKQVIIGGLSTQGAC